MNLPERKATRLKKYDYNAPGAYFVTICTKNKQQILWQNVGATIGRPQEAVLSSVGKIVDLSIRNIPKHYPAITIDNYVIMPDHIHLLLHIHSDTNGRPMVAPTISTVIQQTKGWVTKQVGHSIWQKLFYDHVIRGEEDYLEIWNYIDSNPGRLWEKYDGLEISDR